jgi:hypothetical protein
MRLICVNPRYAVQGIFICSSPTASASSTSTPRSRRDPRYLPFPLVSAPTATANEGAAEKTIAFDVLGSIRKGPE